MNFTGQNDINSTIIEIAHIGVLIFQNTNFSIFDTVLNSRFGSAVRPSLCVSGMSLTLLFENFLLSSSHITGFAVRIAGSRFILRVP